MKKFIAIALLALTVNIGRSQSFTKIFGDTNSFDLVHKILVLPSGNLLVAGSSGAGTAGGQDFALWRLDPMGNVLDSTFFGTPNDDLCSHMFFDGDSLILVGTSYPPGMAEPMVAKCDTNGVVSWLYTYGDVNVSSSFKQGALTDDGEYFMVGWISDTVNQNNNFYHAKLDPSGNLIFNIASGNDETDYFQGVKIDGDGNMIVHGDRQKPSADYGVYIAKFNDNGALIWEQDIITPYNTGCQNIHQYSNGKILIIGEGSTPTSNAFDVFLALIDSTGNQLYWTSWIPGSDDGEAGFATVENGNEMIHCGYGYNRDQGNYDLMIQRYDTTIQEISTGFWGNPNTIDIGYDIIPSNMGGFYVIGETKVGTDKQAILIHIMPAELTIDEKERTSPSVFPNPIKAGGTISLPLDKGTASIISVDGKTVSTQELHSDHMIIPETLPTGVYLLQIDGKHITRIIVE